MAAEGPRTKQESGSLFTGLREFVADWYGRAYERLGRWFFFPTAPSPDPAARQPTAREWSDWAQENLRPADADRYERGIAITCECGWPDAHCGCRPVVSGRLLAECPPCRPIDRAAGFKT